jgi:hypothetical protein
MDKRTEFVRIHSDGFWMRVSKNHATWVLKHALHNNSVIEVPWDSTDEEIAVMIKVLDYE